MKKGFTELIKSNYVLRNVILAVSIVLIIITTSFVFLDIYTKHAEKYTVPNLSGMTMIEAEEAVHEMNSRLVIIDSLFLPNQKAGAVLEQNPKPGSFVKSNRRILLTVNTMTPKRITIPYVAGYSLRQAKNRILGMGLGISKIIFQEDIATNNVIAQKYNGKEITKETSDQTIEIGENLELIVGVRPDAALIKTPTLIGLSIAQAKSILWERGLNVGKVIIENDIDHSNMHDAAVYSQTYNPLHLLEHGNTVGFSVTIDKTKVASKKKALAAINKKLNKLDAIREGYQDTLDILRKTKEKNTIENAHGIVLPVDSVFYKGKIEALIEEYKETIENKKQ